MGNLLNEELFSAIVASNILNGYLHDDPELGALLENPHHCNIHYPRNYSSADQIMAALDGMLDYMVSQGIYLNIEATKQLITFVQKYPDSWIYDITFNCEKQCYGVCCGQSEGEIHAICVLTGNHIPDEWFGN